MLKRLFMWLVVIVMVAGWPLSWWENKPIFNSKTVWGVDASPDEVRVFSEKLGLDQSPMKRFYYNKLTLVKDRYLRNLLVNLDINNYFFGMHPREEITGINYRTKMAYPALLYLAFAVGISFSQKKNIKVWLAWLLLAGVVAVFDQMDGWDGLIYFPLAYLVGQGVAVTNKFRWGGVLNLVMMGLVISELLRIFV